jgi:hypothetical protein
MRPSARTLHLGSWVTVTLLVAMLVRFLGTAEYDHRDYVAPSPDVAGLEEVGRQRARVIEELIAGRPSLFEAAARFRELSAESPVDGLHFLRMYHPRCSDDELHYLHVLMHANGACRRNGAGATIGETLRQEFEARRMCGTLTVDSPDPGAVETVILANRLACIGNARRLRMGASPPPTALPAFLPPAVRRPILPGQGTVTGSWSKDELRYMARMPRPASHARLPTIGRPPHRQ